MKLFSASGLILAALWLFTFSEASTTTNYQESMNKWKLTIDDIYRIG